VSPVKYELGFYIPEDGVLHSHRRESLKSYKRNHTPWPLVHKRTIPNERPSLVGEVSVNFYG
jgi:hypothetical protein